MLRMHVSKAISFAFALWPQVSCPSLEQASSNCMYICRRYKSLCLVHILLLFPSLGSLASVAVATAAFTYLLFAGVSRRRC